MTPARASVGSPATRLCVLRGNSGSGKTSIATEIRRRHGRGIALVSQDTIRRTVLGERDVPGAPNIGLVATVARYALDAGYDVVVEGIMYADRYGDMLEALAHDHQGRSRFYYLDVDCAPCGASLYPRPSREELGRRFLGHPTYLEAKDEGENSMSGKRWPPGGV